MRFPYITCLGDFTLTMESDDASLRPWNASDEYLLNTLIRETLHPERILIINDRYGALSVPLAQRTVALVNDSLCEIEDSSYNLAENGTPGIRNFSSLGEFPDDPDMVLMHIPKSLEYFKLQLNMLRIRIQRPIPLLAAGMSRYLPASFYASFAEATEKNLFSRIVKKSRYYKGELQPLSSGSRQISSEELTSSFPWGEKEFLCYPGIFSQGRLDRGSRFLLENFPDLPEPKMIIDPGCGSGILGLETLIKWPSALLTATDENALAVASTRLNARRLGLEGRCEVVQTQILRGVPGETADLAVCNPPFHRGHTMSVETGFAFIREISRVLKKGGYFLAVVNRSLGYRSVLREHFSRTSVLKQNKDYTLFLCRK